MNLAGRYENWLGLDYLREQPPLSKGREIPDLELQARWFAGEFGREFVTAEGDAVVILDFGVWNREAGAPFVNAVISFQNQSPVRGAIAVNWDARTFRGHVCSEDSEDFESVILFMGARLDGGVSYSGAVAKVLATKSGRSIPQVALSVSRFEGQEMDGLNLEHPCSAPFSRMEEGRVAELLEAAAQFRVCRKAARIKRMAAQFGPEEALYQALAETLGYRNNKVPFMLLAQRFPLALLRAQRENIETLLFAGSGFLTATDLSAMEGDTRSYLRGLWQNWWAFRTEHEALVLPVKFWNLSGLRPVNHPQRRVAALAEIARNWPVIHTLSKTCELSAIYSFFERLGHSYWDFHYTLTSKRARTGMAVVGENRVTAMLANVFLPWAVVDTPKLWDVYRELSAPDSNQKVDLAARRLFGEMPRVFLKQAVFQQGLLQLFEDHCLASGLECAKCSLVERLERW